MDDHVICTASFQVLNTIAKESSKYDEDLTWNEQHHKDFAKLFSDLQPQRNRLSVQNSPTCIGNVVKQSLQNFNDLFQTKAKHHRRKELKVQLCLP